ncbi:AMP-binding protein [Rhodococcus sp. CSLK01-03]|uniref:Acyl-CoA synthetase n=1 Tax=Rhodococcus indonesiensis TaxID=3055869 RepID=A0ABT7RVE3_9NOCA|nr:MULTISPECIES: AMP-binding protein [Rhodococcus]MDM7491618.1 AMP-binding protein [Rhodococcus indonesiensis]WML65823.1 AMP-binding protein [Rhodococcus sp. AH-ZY2]
MQRLDSKHRDTPHAFDADGWLRTADLGEIDADGYLRLVGRKKDILITAPGKNVVPTLVENANKEQTRLLDHGRRGRRGRRYVPALLVPEHEQLHALAAAHGLSGDIGDLVRHPAVRAETDRAIAAANERLAGPETVRAWTLLDHQWRPGGDEVTATMKRRRSVIADKYAPVIDRLHRAAT